MRTFLLALFLFVGLTTAAPVEAQTAVKPNPTVSVFTASAAHGTLLPDGSPLVLGYVRRIINESGATVRTDQLNKPAPAANNDITVSLPGTGLQPNAVYRFQIDVVWSGAPVEASAPSNPFYFVGAPSPATNLRAQ
jgi:hypothetical protein